MYIYNHKIADREQSHQYNKNIAIKTFFLILFMRTSDSHVKIVQVFYR